VVLSIGVILSLAGCPKDRCENPNPPFAQDECYTDWNGDGVDND
jgi:hypothetical protein